MEVLVGLVLPREQNFNLKGLYWRLSEDSM
jgi:hypothetical protein